MRMILMAVLSVLFTANMANPAVVWETNFDSYPDWQSAEQLTGSSPDTIYNTTPEGKSIRTVTGGDFDSYRSARGQLLDSNGEKTYQINSDNAYGGRGKALNCYYEGATLQVGGGFGIHLGPTGYDEVYLRWRMRFNNDWRNATDSGLGGLILKLFRIMSNVDSAWDAGMTDPMNMYLAPATRDDWLTNCAPNYNSSDECGKQAYVILRWEGSSGNLIANKIAYNPEGRAGSVTDLYYNFDGGATVPWKDYHGTNITTDILPTAYNQSSDWVGNGEWVTYEVHAVHNTPGQANGYFEFWLDGVKVGHVSNMTTRSSTDTKFNYVILPDNFYNNIFDSVVEVSTPHSEQVFTIDDVVISTTYIGVDYVIGEDTPTYDQPTISVSDTNTGTSSSYTITGTYYIDPALSAGLCTWSHSSGSVTGFATVLLGVVSGTVTGLPVGTTAVHFSLLDSEGVEATDDPNFIRSAPAVSGVTSTAVSHGVVRY